jgi:TetR/AcrR family transcriptional regulator, tetracycline repressor protein
MEGPMGRRKEPVADGAVRAARRTPGQRAGLARGEVLARARSLAAEAGLERLTMRRLAAELGVTPNALYTYFPDKAALLDAIFDDLLGEIEVPGEAGERWQDDLAELMRASRRLVLAHPGLATLFLTRPGGANGARLGEATFRALERGGVVGRSAVMALRALLSYTLGFAAMEVPRLAEPERGERSGRALDRMASLSPDSFSATRALAPHLAAHAGEADFEAGLRWLIDGIAGG